MCGQVCLSIPRYHQEALIQGGGKFVIPDGLQGWTLVQPHFEHTNVRFKRQCIGVTTLSNIIHFIYDGHSTCMQHDQLQVINVCQIQNLFWVGSKLMLGFSWRSKKVISLNTYFKTKLFWQFVSKAPPKPFLERFWVVLPLK